MPRALRIERPRAEAGQGSEGGAGAAGRLALVGTGGREHLGVERDQDGFGAREERREGRQEIVFAALDVDLDDDASRRRRASPRAARG